MKKKVIVITGAGSGLGKMASIALAKRGHKVYATTQYESQTNELNFLSKKENLDLISFKLNILSEDDRNKLKSINFDTLINNAAIGDSGSVCEVNVDRFKNVFETNVFSNIKITQIAIKKFINCGYGRVIFLSSLAGRISFPFLAPYCSSKFAIEGFATCLREELKKLDYANIDVCIIEPGAYATGFNKENNEKKYDWMKHKSYFKYKIDNIKKIEEITWNLMESKKYNFIVKKYIKAVEDRTVKLRYVAPFSQALLVQFLRIIGF